jgi:ATP-binding cassette subfamily B protein
MTATFMAAVLLARPRLHALNIGEAEATARMTGFLADVMTNISTVKAHGTEHLEQAAAYDVSADWMAADRRVKYGFLGYSTVLSSLIVLTNVGALVASVLLTERADIDLAGVYLAVTYTLVVTGSIWEVNQIMRSYAKVLGDAHHMVSILDTPSTVVDEHEVPLQPGDGEIRFERVVFSYTGADEPLFTGLDLTVAPGEAVGLVGPSGSGKTTLTRLLLRYFDVDAGRVVVDGQDVRDVTQASLRRTIAYVPQDPMLFHRSIRENIAYGLPDATEEMVREAAAKAQALGFIEALPRGFDTDIGERGVKLSGGQRQRIAIARAILKDARILVFDEATSALDSASEAVIQRALTEAMAGRTTIIIAHRLSTVARMDRIAVMSNGRIVEEGPPGELLTRGGAFAALWDHESGGFVHSPGG